MFNYVVRRILQSIPVIIGITIITFAIMQLAPGNPMETMIDPKIPVEDIQRAQEKLGMDQPVLVQYFNWLKEIFKGNLGYTVKTQQPVAKLISERLPATLLLTISAFILSFCLGVPLGVFSATHKYSKGDYGLTVFSLIGISIPSFFFGLSMIYVFAIKLGWFPTSGIASVKGNLTGMALFLDQLWHLALPALVLALPNMATTMRFTRSSMIDVMRNDYIRTARAKGVKEKTIRYSHALRNALIPVVTLIGLSIPFLFGGAYITESIFAWPGMGSLGIDAITGREYPIVMGLNLVTSALVLGGNLLADILYALVDPRIRYS